ncbi:response regulator [bacterium]|nr:response regulator [bacterium]NUN46247.1 response regulator [bacterium]HMV25648.1 response regulator [bacterium]HMW32046.1 response regulator [bacterium]HMW34784.1 response regulator [bacterium]
MIKQKTILLVEDNEVNMRLVERTIKNPAYTIVSAGNGEEALERAAQYKPDLIILDIQIPKMDGYAVARTLKADPALKHIPIIALTAHAMKGDEEKILAAGCDSYVSKPIEVSKFREKINDLLSDKS